MITEDIKKRYDARFRHFVREIIVVSRMNPKEKFFTASWTACHSKIWKPRS